jgi:hypothetical protein
MRLTILNIHSRYALSNTYDPIKMITQSEQESNPHFLITGEYSTVKLFDHLFNYLIVTHRHSKQKNFNKPLQTNKKSDKWVHVLYILLECPQSN